MVGLSRITVSPELMLTLELDRDTALAPEVVDEDTTGITEAVEPAMPDGPRVLEAAGGTTTEAVPALS